MPKKSALPTAAASPNALGQTDGGRVNLRGVQGQILISLFDILRADPPFVRLTIEPDEGGDKFDYTWDDDAGPGFAVQVKTTQNKFTKKQLQTWATQMRAQRSTRVCRLWLLGYVPKGCKDGAEIDGVKLSIKPLDLAGLNDSVTLGIARLTGLGAVLPVEVAEILNRASVGELLELGKAGRTITRAQLAAFLQRAIAHVPRKGVQTEVSRLIPYAPARLLGREGELARLRTAWAEAGTQPSPPIFAIIALGGEGKTSLLAKWMQEMQASGWQGAQAVFAWSFYSQGSSEQSASSSDMFLAEALQFFGEAELAASNLAAYDKGKKLAACCARQRTLLLLDGVESLQYAPTSPTRGELKDQGMLGLLRGLGAQGGAGGSLCVLTSRYALPQIAGHCGEIKLPRLPKDAAIALLRAACPIGGEADYARAVDEVKGHALALHILAQYVKEAHGGDIRQRDLLDWQEADDEETHGHAFRAMAAYGKWLAQDESAHGARALAMLHVLGLFDRPAERRLVQALLQTEEPLARLTALRGLAEKDWNICVQRLAEAGMLSRNPAQGPWQSLDAHPLLREYFARHWQEQDAAGFRAAHKVLFEFLQANTKEGDQPSLTDLQPLYQAVAHGCWAGEVEAACINVYRRRIVRGDEFYSRTKLGAYAQNLAATACFFTRPWQQLAPGLSEANQAWLLSHVAFSLRALGRLAEAVQPMQTGLNMHVARQDRKNAAIQASNIAELHLLLGNIAVACSSAQQAVVYAEQSGDAAWRALIRVTLADVQHQAGQEAAALVLMQEVECMQAKMQPTYPLLYSVQGFRYCELLLAGGTDNAQQVAVRARQTLEWAQQHGGLLETALDHLTLARCALQQALPEALAEAEQALAGLRQAGNSNHLPRALLTRAAVLCRTEPVAAIADLNESFDLCQRGPMPLLMADTLLTRVRLFAPRAAQHPDAAPAQHYPWPSPQADLQEARRIIDECGYERRRAELEELNAQYAQEQPAQSAPPQ